MIRRFSLGLAVLAVLVPASCPALAQGLTAGAHVYELTENAKFILRGRRPIETAVSQMMGFADPGTPLCPAAFAAPVPVLSGRVKCVINVTGTDSVSLTTGRGPISGRFTVVMPTATDVDAPEIVVMRGSFRGQMDFSPALQRIPYGTVTGRLTVDAGGDDGPPRVSQGVTHHDEPPTTSRR